MDSAVPEDNREKLKGNEKKDKCLVLAEELKKRWNKKVMVILMVIDALGIIALKIGTGTGRL